MQGRNALILVLDTKNTGKSRLRFFEGAPRKRRDLGTVPFASAELNEGTQSDGNWAFVLSGNTEKGPALIVADLNGIHGRVDGAIAPKLDFSTLTYRDAGTGEMRAIPIRYLLASSMTGIYAVRASDTGELEYAQFLPDGSAVLAELRGQFHTGDWWTDGDNMVMAMKDGQRFAWPRASLVSVEGIPAETRLVVRLLQPLASQKAKEGDPVKAVLISPATIDGKILLPQSEFSGTITKAHGVGWALRHETAALTLEFETVKLPDGQTEAIDTRLYQVENSRETVNDKGTIQGVRSTGTLGSSAESKIASVATIDPVAYLFTTVSATAALGFAEPEILYPAGTELEIQFTAPLVTSQTFQSSIPALAASPEDQEKLGRFVRELPFRTMTKGSNKPSDLTNLAFIGPPDGLRRAFQAAGWVYTDQLTAEATFQTLKTIGGNRSYNQAPMSVLLLDERPPIFTLTKTTNTFSSRHHIRVFDPALRYDGVTVLTASSTQDIGIAFSSKQKTFIHVIDQYIDNERSKVVNDLEFTGCVQAMELARVLGLLKTPIIPQATDCALMARSPFFESAIARTREPRPTARRPPHPDSSVLRGTPC
ncbi:MAG: LssY C-terminal domain-containing protein [Bryobacteraceae bacterium]